MLAGLLGCTSASANDDIRVYLNGERLEFDTAPLIMNDRTMVPMRGIFETLGAGVYWRDDSPGVDVRWAECSWRYTFLIGSTYAEAFHPHGGVCHDIGPTVIVEYTIPMEIAPVVIGDRTLVPLRAVTEIFGATVEWCNQTRTVTIDADVAAFSPRCGSCQSHANENATTRDGQTFEAALFAAMPTDENYMVSPFSLRMALAMVANGATGVSQAEILEILNIDDLNAFNRATSSFIANSNANELVELNIANSIWLNADRFPNTDIDFRDTYAHIIANYFAGSAERINAHNGADVINAWIAQQTRDRITDVIHEDTFDEESEILAVLVNAIYFQGSWAVPFNGHSTSPGTFTNRDGTQATIPIMQQTGGFRLYEGDYFRMLAKPYADRDIRMYFVLPNVDARLPFSMFEDAIDSMNWEEVRLRLPRFRTEFTHENLVEILQEMGMSKAFEEGHFDFWPMVYPTYVSGEPLFIWIDEVLQKVFIEVDEEGTEAAAATVVYMGAVPTSEPPPPVPFYLDRPFVYFIRNDVTGDILFMGEFAFGQ